jgi:hypothetical protein
MWRRALADPNLPPIGRQPHIRGVIASKLADGYPWYGDISGYEIVNGYQVGGDRWTREQVTALIKLGLDPLTCKSMMVRRQSVGEEVVVGLGNLPAVFEFECPVIKAMKGGRIKVIAPNGCFKFVLPDGWGHRPFRRPRDEHESYVPGRILGAGGSASRAEFSTHRRAIR